MNLYWVTVCHMATRVMGVAQTRLEETVTKRELESIKRGVIVNHLYPLEECEKFIWQWAIDWKFEYRKPKVNLGGHGGQSFGIHALGEISDEDLVFVIDPDSYPRSKGWFTAAVEALKADPELGAVSLMPAWVHGNFFWRQNKYAYGEPPREVRVGFLPHSEMWNMTAFKAKVLKRGMLAERSHYGFVEQAMWEHFREMGLKHGYLLDYFEDQNPEPHDELYTQWKAEHAFAKDPRNFDEWVEAKRPKVPKIDPRQQPLPGIV